MGPSGPDGGALVYAGPVEGMVRCIASRTFRLRDEQSPKRPSSSRGAATRRKKAASSAPIAIRGARANNLRSIDVDFPKSRITVVTGLSGCGKSSLVGEVLEAEASKRFLETLSLYERQGVKEGPEVAADTVTGLGVTASIRADRSRMYNPRHDVGLATGMTHQLSVVLAFAGSRRCPSCREPLQRDGTRWLCRSCGPQGRLPEPRLFLPRTYAAACHACNGVGTVSRPRPEKLIVRPDKPLCGGAMHSPGFFPQGYLCKPYNGGYDMVQALASKHGFDPAATPWEQMTEEARRAFLFGEKDALRVVFHSRKGMVRERTLPFRGFYGWVGDWDTTGTYFEMCRAPPAAEPG